MIEQYWPSGKPLSVVKREREAEDNAYTVGESAVDGHEPVFWPTEALLPSMGVLPVDVVMLCPNSDHQPPPSPSVAWTPPRVTLRPEKWASELYGEDMVIGWGRCPDCGRRYMSQSTGPLELRFMAELCLSVQETLKERHPRIRWRMEVWRGDGLILRVQARLGLKYSHDLACERSLPLLYPDQWVRGENVIFRWVRQLAWRSMWGRIDSTTANIARDLVQGLLRA